MRMKKSILFLLMLATTSLCFAQRIVKQEEIVQEDIKQKDKGEMEFEKTRHDFGIFAQDTAIVTYDFVFTNVGKAPLIIHSASASCGCTVPEYTLEPIMPGCHGKISVTYNGKQSPIRLYIEGEMIEGAPAKPVELIQEEELYRSTID